MIALDSMSIPSKPCSGGLSQETQQLLRSTRNRAQWSNHPCDVCGRVVGVEQAGGQWVPERHWPSVAYPPRRVPVGRFDYKVRGVRGQRGSLLGRVFRNGAEGLGGAALFTDELAYVVAMHRNAETHSLGLRSGHDSDFSRLVY